MIGSHFSLRGDPGLRPVRVLLWQSRHDDRGIEFLVAPEPGARRVYVRHCDQRAPLAPCRRAGDRWTRCVVTITRRRAEELSLTPASEAEIAAALAERQTLSWRK